MEIKQRGEVDGWRRVTMTDSRNGGDSRGNFTFNRVAGVKKYRTQKVYQQQRNELSRNSRDDDKSNSLSIIASWRSATT